MWLILFLDIGGPDVLAGCNSLPVDELQVLAALGGAIMRLPQPEVQSDPILDMVGKRVVVILDGVKIRGKLISARDGFLCLEPYNGPRMTSTSGRSLRSP